MTSWADNRSTLGEGEGEGRGEREGEGEREREREEERVTGKQSGVNKEGAGEGREKGVKIKGKKDMQSK